MTNLGTTAAVRLDTQSQKLLRNLLSADRYSLEDLTVEGTRRRLRELAAKFCGEAPELEEVTELALKVSDAPIRLRIYNPSPADTLPVLVWFHGGGFVAGDLDTEDTSCCRLAVGGRCIVVSVDYRLAPENRFPAAFDDAYAVVEWISRHAGAVGADPARIAIGGNSSGGNLAAAVAVAARDRRGPRISHQVLIYPILDATMSSYTYARYTTDLALTAGKMAWFLDQYVEDGIDRKSPGLSPLWAPDLSHLPPAFIVTAEHDPLRGEAEAYAQRLRDARVKVSQRNYEGVMHGFFSQAGVLDKGRLAVEETCHFLRTSLTT